MAISIEPALPSQADEINACVEAAYQHYISRIGKPPGPMLENYADAIAHHEVYIAIGDEKTAISGVLLLKPGDEIFLLDSVAVHPGAQGQGLGSTMIKQGTRICDEQHMPAYLESKRKEPAALPAPRF